MPLMPIGLAGLRKTVLIKRSQTRHRRESVTDEDSQGHCQRRSPGDSWPKPSPPRTRRVTGRFARRCSHPAGCSIHSSRRGPLSHRTTRHGGRGARRKDRRSELGRHSHPLHPSGHTTRHLFRVRDEGLPKRGTGNPGRPLRVRANRDASSSHRENVTSTKSSAT